MSFILPNFLSTPFSALFDSDAITPPENFENSSETEPITIGFLADISSGTLLAYIYAEINVFT
jgi:hypothetical protein